MNNDTNYHIQPMLSPEWRKHNTDLQSLLTDTEKTNSVIYFLTNYPQFATAYFTTKKVMKSFSLSPEEFEKIMLYAMTDPVHASHEHTSAGYIPQIVNIASDDKNHTTEIKFSDDTVAHVHTNKNENYDHVQRLLYGIAMKAVGSERLATLIALCDNAHTKSEKPKEDLGDKNDTAVESNRAVYTDALGYKFLKYDDGTIAFEACLNDKDTVRITDAPTGGCTIDYTWFYNGEPNHIHSTRNTASAIDAFLADYPEMERAILDSAMTGIYGLTCDEYTKNYFSSFCKRTNTASVNNFIKLVPLSFNKTVFSPANYILMTCYTMTKNEHADATTKQQNI